MEKELLMPAPIVLNRPSFHLASPNFARTAAQIIAQREHKRRFTTKDIERDLEPVRRSWRTYRESHDKLAVYRFLHAVYTLVVAWKAAKRSQAIARRLLNMQEAPTYMVAEPFSMVILSASKHLDHRSRSKRARTLRFAAREKVPPRKLVRFLQKRGGLNRCAASLGQASRRSS